jgi:hypothetical protein
MERAQGQKELLTNDGEWDVNQRNSIQRYVPLLMLVQGHTVLSSEKQ